MMKQSIQLNQKLNHTLNLTQTMQNSLAILHMDQNDLIRTLESIVESNPVIEYTPSVDMHQFLNETLSKATTLSDELYLQLHTTSKPYHQKAAEYIIESLDENGFFTNTIEDSIYDLSINQKVFEETLSLIQSFEPCGVAAQNSVDSIRIQLQSQLLFEAIDILLHYKKEIIHKEYKKIAKQKGITLSEVLSYIDDIKACNPFPCSLYNQNQGDMIIPDFEIKISDQEIEILPRSIGHIYVEDELKALKKENAELKKYFEDAYFFIDSLSKRNKTLLLLANELIHIQKNYFLFKDELKPCTLSDIAKISGFHESTVSRALSNKYYIFENEIYPVKDLFVSATKEGSSKDAILKAIKKLIDEEDKHQPLADFEIVEKLEQLELFVSRRAISKYRLLLNIPNSKDRKIK